MAASAGRSGRLDSGQGFEPAPERLDLPEPDGPGGGGPGGGVGRVEQRADPGEVARGGDLAAPGGLRQGVQERGPCGLGRGVGEGEVEDHRQLGRAAEAGDQAPDAVLVGRRDLAAPQGLDQRAGPRRASRPR